MQITRKKKTICWILSLLLCIGLIPELAFAGSSETSNAGSSEEETVKPEDVTKEDVIEPEKTVDSTSYDLGKGEKMTVFHGGEVRYENKEGDLVDYDPSLVSVRTGEKSEQGASLAQYSAENKEGDKKQYLPKTLSESTPILMEHAGYQIAFTPTEETLEQVGAADETIEIEKEAVPTIYEGEEKLPIHATYDASAADAAFTYTSGEHGLKETIKLRQAPKSNVFQYQLNLKGLCARKNGADEGITFYDKKTDDIRADIAVPWMNDASGEAYSEAITYDLAKVEGTEDTYLLTMTVDQGYLKDESRQYPVTIDPTTTWVGSSDVKDAYVISGSKYGNTNFYSSSVKVMPSGKNSTGTHRTLIKFMDLKAKIGANSVSDAKLTVYETGSGASKQTINAKRITSSWTLGSLTYNKQPTYGGTYDTITTKKTAGSAQTFDVTSFAKSVASGTITNYGLLLSNTTASADYAVLHGSRTSSSSYRPKLTVTYYSKPTTATSNSITPGTVKSSTDAKITYKGITSTGLDRVEYKIYKYNDSTKEKTVYQDYAATKTFKASGAALPALPNGCYVFAVRGVNKAGVAGSQKSSGVVHVDSAVPKIGTMSLSPSTEEKPGPASPKLSWSVSDAHLKQIDYAVDGGAYKKAGTAASGHVNIPKTAFKETGIYTIKVKVTDTAGNETSKTFSNYYVCLDGPEIGSLKLKAGERENLGESDWTRDGNPTILFSGVRNKIGGFRASGITYAMVKAEEEPEADAYKEPKGLTFTSEEEPYSGSFQLTSTDQAASDGAYEIYVQFTNTLGNYAEKVLVYNKDTVNPAGSLSVTDITGSTEITNLSDTVLITGKVSDQTSGVTDSNVKLYQDGKQAGIIYLDNSKEGSSNAAGEGDEATASTVRAIDTSKYDNGSYTLKLAVKDHAGNTKQAEQDVKIANQISKPNITLEKNEQGKEILSWKLKANVAVSKVQYKVNENGTWISIPASSKGSGSVSLDLPKKDGSYQIFVRGVDAAGIGGKEAEIKCTVDTTAPITEIASFTQGMLAGTASDDHLASWTVSMKEKDAGDDTYHKVLEGTEPVKNRELGFIDLSGDAYQAGKTYTLQLAAVDQSGNVTKAEKEIVREGDDLVATKITSSFQIKRINGQGSNDKTIIFPTSLEKMELAAKDGFTLDAAKTTWFVSGLKKAEGSIYQEDFSAEEDSPYAADQPYPVVVASKDADGKILYSSSVIQNGEIQKISFKGMMQAGGSFTKEIDLTSQAAAFRLMGEKQAADGTPITYGIKLADGIFKTITPGQRYPIAELEGSGVSKSKLTLRLTAAGKSGDDIQDLSLVCDTLEEETFTLSSVEDFRPVALSAKDQINYKTYLKWELAGGQAELPDDIRYEVYRSTEDGFTPSSETLAAKNVEGQSFAEMNTGYGKQFYYKVRAVKVDGEDEVLSSSGFSKQAQGRVVDGHEFTKRLGMREYWAYADMATPNGTASIEKSEGNLVYQQTDASLPNEALEVNLERTYNSKSTARSAFGTGWSHTYDMELLKLNEGSDLAGEKMVLRYGDGSMYQFMKDRNNSDTYISSLGKQVMLEEEEGSEVVTLPERKIGVAAEDDKQEVTVGSAYTVKDKDGTEYRFNESGQLVLEKEPNGNFLLFSYDQIKGLLSKVTTSRNLSMEFVYTSSTEDQDPLTVKEVKLPDGSSFEYDYEGDTSRENPRLVSVTHKGSDGQVISYAYDYDNAEVPNLDVIYDAKGSKYKVDYEKEAGQALSIQDPEGKKLQLTYSANGYETKTETSVKPGWFFSQVIATETDRFDGYFGNCMESIDAAGNTTRYTYNRNLLESTTTQASYQAVDKVTKEVQFKETTKVESSKYDGADNEVLEKTTGEGQTKYTYDADGNVLSELSRNEDNEVDSDLEYKYDEFGNEIYSYDEITGEEEDTDYFDEEDDFAGEVKSETSKISEDPAGPGETISKTTYIYEYTGDGKKVETVTELCDGVATTTIITTDVMGRELSTETKVNGKTTGKTEKTYDGFGRLVKTVTTQGEETSITTNSYDENGTVIQETAADGTKTSYGYDSINRVTEKTIEKGELSEAWTTQYGYEDVSIFAGDGKRKQVDNAYVTIEKDPGGDVASQTYVDALGNTIREKDQGLYSDMTYDKQGNMMTSYIGGKDKASTDGILTLTLYDANGNQTHTAQNPNVSNGNYRLTGNGIVTENQYDSAGNMTASIDGEGNMVRNSYDIENQLIEIEQPGKTITRFAYEKGEQSKATTTDANGNTKVTVTNARDLEETVTDYLDQNTAGIQRTYTYDGKGNKVKETELSGQYKTFSYDGKNRLAQTNYFDKNKVETLRTKYTYDKADQITLMRDFKVSSGQESLYRTTKYTYDGLKRMTGFAEWNGSQDQSDARKTSYSYDLDGNLTEIDYPNVGSEAKGLVFTYTADKWLKEIQVKTDGWKKTLREYEYDDYGKVTEMRDYRDFMNGSNYIQRTYAYDQFNRVKKMVYADSKDLDQVMESYGYAYDKNSNILEEKMVSNYVKEGGTGIDQTRSYTYDALGRLTKSVVKDNNAGGAADQVTAYKYDKVGNRISENISNGDLVTVNLYNGLNQLTNSTEVKGGNAQQPTGKKTYSYDENGNQTSVSDSVTKESSLLSYDADNRLSKYIAKKDNVVEVTQENLYNGDGQRIQKKETKDKDIAVKNYYYQNGVALYTTDEQEKLNSYNLMGTSNNVIATEQKDNGASKWYTYNKDVRESTSSLVDQSGAVAVAYAYDDFGETTVKAGAGFDNEVCYTGQVMDQSTGLYYYNARFYDPEDGRFLTQDTYRGEQHNSNTWHLYTYCHNDPINRVDPSGHDSYTFTISEFKDESKGINAILKSYYKKDSHLLTTDSTGSFKRKWNGMKGKRIQSVVINSHANPEVLSMATKSVVRSLKKKPVKRLILLGCNAAHDNYDNIARAFRKKVKGPVMGSDGTVSSHGSFCDESSVFTSHADKTWRDWRNAAKSKRKNNLGWVQFVSSNLLMYKGRTRLTMKGLLRY